MNITEIIIWLIDSEEETDWRKCFYSSEMAQLCTMVY